jgi:histone-lysine N-methyltransferase SETMAR
VKHPSSSTAKKKNSRQRQVRKVIATVFWDTNGLLLVDFIHNAECYIHTLLKLGQAIRRNHVGMLTRVVKLFHDNASPHTAGKTHETIKMCWEILEHPPHSPDLAPSDFHQIGKLKEHPSGKRFASDQ